MTTRGNQPGRETVADTPGAGGAEPLALDARVERTADGGWRITVPLRAERVRADRETVVREEVVLRPRVISDVERVEGEVAREELRVDVQGDLEATQPIERP
jgi:stress response protein YsnF